MNIAIIGAGFCGLATAWHMLHYFSSASVTLFDVKGIGKGASGIAAGLLHPFSGAHAKLNWRGREGIVATKELLAVAAEFLGRPVTAKNRGILRLALSGEQQVDFQLCAERYPLETQWVDTAFCQKMAPGSPEVPGLWIEDGLTIYSPLYLEGLWLACKSRGVHFEQKCVQSLQELDSFDAIIVTAGADCPKIQELSSLSLNCVKGQVLELAWPKHIPPLKCALNSHVYILMTEEGESCLVGATYEKGFQEAIIDLEIAKQEILPKAYELYPPLKNASIKNCYAGMRAVTSQHRPLIKRESMNTWVLTGMGSKGLLYHALFAKELAGDIHTVYQN